MINVIVGGIAAALGYLLMQSDADYKRGLALLAKNPDDVTGNLVVGAYLGSQGKWDEALPYLLKSGNKDVVDAATKDTAGAPNGKLDQLEVGDLFATAAVKVAKYKKAFNDRAMTWYAKCWPDLDGPFKDKLRTRLKQILGRPGGASPVQQLNSWNQAAGKVFSSGQYAVTGNKSLRLDPDPKVQYTYLSTMDYPALAGKDYVFSGWILTDGTEGLDDIKLDVFGQGNKLLDQKKLTASPDTPLWKFFQLQSTFPPDSVSFKVTVEMASRMGSVWYDDVSLKANGKELIKNGSFD